MALLLLWPLKQLLEIQDKNEILPSAEELPKNQQLHVKIYTNLALLPPLVGIGFLGALIGATHPVWQSVLLGAVLGALVGAVGLVLLVLLAKIISWEDVGEGILEGLLEGL